MVDDFGVRYMDKKGSDHLISSLQEIYEVTKDWTGGIYCRIKLKCNHKARQLDISIPGYVKDALHKFQHPAPTRPQHTPHQWAAPKYGSTDPQMAHSTDDSPALNPYEANTVHQVVGAFLYHARAVDPTILVALNKIAAQQYKST